MQTVLAGLEPDRASQDLELYELLLDWSDAAGARNFAPLLREVSCVRVIDGSWRTPPEVFFERQRGHVDFPDQLHVPIADLPDLSSLRALLEQAGVRPFEWRYLVARVLIPMLTDPDESQERRRAAFSALASYFHTERSGDAQLDKLLSGVMVEARTARHTRAELRPASEVYFSAEWLGHDRLERLYGSFDDYEFLAEIPPPHGGNHDRSFYERLGVSPCVRVLRETAENRRYPLTLSGDNYVLPAHHPHAKAAPRAWKAWSTDLRVQQAAACPRGHSQSQFLTQAAALDGFEELVEAADWARLAVLLTELGKNWTSTYASAMTATFTCQHSEHAGSSRSAPSLLAFMLGDNAWVPAVRGDEPVIVPGHRAWRLGFDTPRAVRRSVACIPPELDQGLEGFAAAAEFIDAARPTATQLAWLLQQLADEAQDELTVSKATQDAARWAMRTLNDVLRDRDEEALRSMRVPLLARLADTVRFNELPYVAVNRQLADTWQPTHPILDGDRDLGRLQRALDLPDLDKAVHVVARPSGVEAGFSSQVLASLRAASPYLYAVAADHSPAQAQQVARRLQRLDVLACSQLTVLYQLEDEERERSAETCHIATRVEIDGRRRQYGTAYVALDSVTKQPDWYRLGPLLAEYVGSPPLGHAYSLLLSADSSSRQLFLRSLGIGSDRLAAAHEELGQDVEDDDLEQEFAHLVTNLTSTLAAGPGPDAQTAESVTAAEPAGPDTAEASATQAAADDPPLPPIDPEKVTVRRVTTKPYPTAGDRVRTGRAQLGPKGPYDHAGQHRRNSTIGARGEQAVFDHERRRVEEAGLDPEVVEWVAREHPLAPYDIKSVADDGLTSYIEVKATKGDDPSAAFPISERELLEAMRRGSRYWIYRVLRADTEAPEIVPFGDPVTLLREGHAELSMLGAKLAFGTSTDADDSDT